MNLAKTTIKCPNCGTENISRLKGTNSLECKNCRNLIATKEAPEVLGLSKARKGTYKSGLKLGMKGSFAKWEGQGKIEIEILGMLLYHQYDEGHYYWEEWFLVGDDGYYWLVYDLYQQGIHFLQAITDY